MDEEYRKQYTPAKYQEAPVSLQLVAGRLQEEKLLAMVKCIDSLLKKDTVEPIRTTVPIKFAAQDKRDFLTTAETTAVIA